MYKFPDILMLSISFSITRLPLLNLHWSSIITFPLFRQNVPLFCIKSPLIVKYPLSIFESPAYWLKSPLIISFPLLIFTVPLLFTKSPFTIIVCPLRSSSPPINSTLSNSISSFSIQPYIISELSA